VRPRSACRVGIIPTCRHSSIATCRARSVVYRGSHPRVLADGNMYGGDTGAEDYPEYIRVLAITASARLQTAAEIPTTACARSAGLKKVDRPAVGPITHRASSAWPATSTAPCLVTSRLELRGGKMIRSAAHLQKQTHGFTVVRALRLSIQTTRAFPQGLVSPTRSGRSRF